MFLSSPPSASSLKAFTQRKRIYVACVHCRKRKIRNTQCITDGSEGAQCGRYKKKGLSCGYVPVCEEREKALFTTLEGSENGSPAPSFYRPRTLELRLTRMVMGHQGRLLMATAAAHNQRLRPFTLHEVSQAATPIMFQLWIIRLTQVLSPIRRMHTPQILSLRRVSHLVRHTFKNTAIPGPALPNLKRSAKYVFVVLASATAVDDEPVTKTRQTRFLLLETGRTLQHSPPLVDTFRTSCTSPRPAAWPPTEADGRA
ncbi:hypothetical protein DFH06DRAFT_1121896 [Mycena polygramma]|nr:hypothetical protein DFH06DRAFT_1121896 [Mycena polygramma]